jgi:WD40 repeat protein/nucleoside phosphorylase
MGTLYQSAFKHINRNSLTWYLQKATNTGIIDKEATMTAVLTRYFSEKGLERLLPHLNAGFQNLTRLLINNLAEDGRAVVADLLTNLFPASTTASANSSLNRLLTTLNKTAKEHGIPLSVKTTADKKAGAAGRWVWCEGEAGLPAPPHTGDLNTIPPAVRQTGQRGVVLGAPVVLLTFNAHETRAVLDRFATHEPRPPVDATGDFPVNHLGIHGGMEVRHIVSEQGSSNARTTAEYAIQRFRPCAVIAVGIAFGMTPPPKQHIGDVLVSKHLHDYEAGRINADGTFNARGDRPHAAEKLLSRVRDLDHKQENKPNWPKLHVGTVMCGDKLVDHRPTRDAFRNIEPEAIGGEMEGCGIEIACRKTKTDWIVIKGICDWADGGKNNSTKESDQRLAADNAALVVKAMLDMDPLQPIDPPPAGPIPAQPAPAALLTDRRQLPEGHYLRGVKGRAVSLQKDALAAAPAEAEAPGEDVLNYLHDWIKDPAAPPLLALLGEYGMGKTITCQQLAMDLDKARKEDARRPLPLYFDLRHVTRENGRVPTLGETLAQCMEGGWHDHGGRNYTLDQIHDWIAEGAVVIIDGLDEVLVKLNTYDGQIFTNSILKLIADTRARKAADGKTRQLKMVLTCRTSYFPTLRAQQTHFTQQERGEMDAGQYRALLLLPWTDEQIRLYLEAALPETDADRVFDTIRSVHNLEELAARPFTLKLVAGFIPEIERLRAEGRCVQGVTLYRAMVQRWLERDSGKHHILPEHKMRLVAHLAAHLWRTGRSALPADELQGWFHIWRDSQPDLRRYASMPADQLEEDLRTATFLVRQDDPKGSIFRFAHTSLFEFFLAEHLFRALHNQRPDDWALPVPSNETLDFLGQMLAEAKADNPALIQTLQGWRRTYRAQTSELLLSYALRARDREWPVPVLHGIDLRSADLRGWRIAGGKTRLNLGPAMLARSDLRNADFTGLNLEGADFQSARLDHATLIDCRLNTARFEDTSLTATVLRRCQLVDIRWAGTKGYCPQFLLCQPDLNGDGVPGMLQSLAQPQFAPATQPPATPTTSRLKWLTGHYGEIWACAWSPDGQRIASTGEDGALRLWDAQTGEVVAALTGHQGTVCACAWSPDGRQIASAGDYGTLLIWDTEKGEIATILAGHQETISACSWSSDGQRIVSAGSDSVLRIWDIDSGKTIATLTGHHQRVLECAWSSNGRRIVSAGADSTLRVWDADSGEAIATLNGHPYGVSACALSADGRRIISAGEDALLLWDADSGEVITTLTGYRESVLMCAWSTDGRRIASAGRDGSLRLWDAESGDAIATLDGHLGTVWTCAWSPEGRRIVSAGADRTLRLWDADNGQAIATLDGHLGTVWTCAWSPEGQQIASVGEDGTLRLWEADSGEAIATLNGHSEGASISVCSWSPDGRRIASGDDDGTLLLWDADSGEATATRNGHQGAVLMCAWLPDGSSSKLG